MSYLQTLNTAHLLTSELIEHENDIRVPLFIIGSYATVNSYVPMFLFIFWRAPWNDHDKVDDPWAVWEIENSWFYYGWYFMWIGNMVFWLVPSLLWPFCFF